MISTLRRTSSAASSGADRASPPHIGTRWRCSVLLCSHARAEPAELPRHGRTQQLDRTSIDTLSAGLSSAAEPQPQPANPTRRNESKKPQPFCWPILDCSILDCRIEAIELPSETSLSCPSPSIQNRALQTKIQNPNSFDHLDSPARETPAKVSVRSASPPSS